MQPDGTIRIPEADGRIEATTELAVERAVSDVAAAAQAWVDTSLDERIGLLRRAQSILLDVAPAWGDAGARAKGIRPGTTAFGEDIGNGAAHLARALRLFQETLTHLRDTGEPPQTDVQQRPDGTVVVESFPTTLHDRVLMPGVRGEAWLRPGMTPDTVKRGKNYRRRVEGHPIEPGVAFVLGAGNASGLPATDALDQLLVHDRVVVLKMNPVNEWAGPFLERVLAPFIEQDALRIVYGGAAVGQLLVQHPDVTHLHMTGSDKTYDAIVWGAGDEGEQRRQAGTPLVDKPFSAELGNVSPVIVVPGPWSDADVDAGAKKVANWLVHNAGFICACPRVIVTHAAWVRRGDFLNALRGHLDRAPDRVPYYPGARTRWEFFTEAHPEAEVFGDDGPGCVPWTLIADLDRAVDHDPALRVEAFNGTLAEVGIDAPLSIDRFLDHAVTFCNERLWGTLSANMLVHPRTLKQHAEAVDRAIARLEYGTVAINDWSAMGGLLMSTSWGAYPGHTPRDIQSGVGQVGNTLLIEDIQKTVLRSPWKTPGPDLLDYDLTHARAVMEAWVEAEVKGPAFIPKVLYHVFRP